MAVYSEKNLRYWGALPGGGGFVGHDRAQWQALIAVNDRRKWSISRLGVRNGRWDRTQRPFRTPNCDFDHKEHRIINNVR